MTPIDTYRDAFLKFVSEGMSYAEAMEQFDEDEFTKAAMAEVFAREARIIRDASFRTYWVTNDHRQLPALWEFCIKANRENANQIDMEQQAVPLMLAGWTSETPECFKSNSKDFWRQCPVMSLYWRAPSKRPGKPGRRYLSTQQAFNAMNRIATP